MAKVKVNLLFNKFRYLSSTECATDASPSLQSGKQTIMQQPVLLKPANSVTLCTLCKGLRIMEILPDSTSEGDCRIHPYKLI